MRKACFSAASAGRLHRGRSLREAAGALTEMPWTRAVRHSAAPSVLGWCGAHSTLWVSAHWSGAPPAVDGRLGRGLALELRVGPSAAAASPCTSAMTPTARWLARCCTPAAQGGSSGGGGGGVLLGNRSARLACRDLLQSVGRGQRSPQQGCRIFLVRAFAVAAGRGRTAGPERGRRLAPPDCAVRWFLQQGWAPAGSTQR